MQFWTSTLLAARRKLLVILTVCSLSVFIIHVYNTTDSLEIEIPRIIQPALGQERNDHSELVSAEPDIINLKLTPLTRQKDDNLNQVSKDETDYFKDFPSPMHKPNCLRDGEYNLSDPRASVVIYMKDDIESLPLQTFLSVLQFTTESRVHLDRVILTFDTRDPLSIRSHQDHVQRIRTLAKGKVEIDTISDTSEWRAKRSALELVTTKQVVIMDDTMIVNRGYLPPLLSVLETNSRMLVYPLQDSLKADRIYLPLGGAAHPDELIWQEVHMSLYQVNRTMNMTRTETSNVRNADTPATQRSAGLTGEILAGNKDHLLKVLSVMKTDEPAELSLLSWLCGDGIVANKCSAVVRTRELTVHSDVPHTQNKQLPLLQQLYLYSQGNTTLNAASCKSGKWYFDELLPSLA